MNFNKATILNSLWGNGQDGDADRTRRDLPSQVDTDERAGLLGKFGINSADLIAKFADGDSDGPDGSADSASVASPMVEPGSQVVHDVATPPPRRYRRLPSRQFALSRKCLIGEFGATLNTVLERVAFLELEPGCDFWGRVTRVPAAQASGLAAAAGQGGPDPPRRRPPHPEQPHPLSERQL